MNDDTRMVKIMSLNDSDGNWTHYVLGLEDDDKYTYELRNAVGLEESQRLHPAVQRFISLNLNNACFAIGGAGRKSSRSAQWKSTGRKVVLKDGRERTVYRCVGKPGEVRIKQLVMRNGKRVARFVRPN